MKIFSIEGNIGSGKSTLIAKLKEYYSQDTHIVFLPEPVDEWNKIVDSDGVGILTKYYSDQKRYAFSFQMMAFITRIKQIKETFEEYSSRGDIVIITERCVFTDREIFAKMLYDAGKIELVEYSIYLQWFDFFIKDINIYGIIYVKSNPEVCANRINIRNRSGELIPIEYLTELNNYHNNWLLGDLGNLDNGKNWNNTNLLLIDGNLNYSNDLPEIWIDKIVFFLTK